jgi:hypothetical protein
VIVAVALVQYDVGLGFPDLRAPCRITAVDDSGRGDDVYRRRPRSPRWDYDDPGGSVRNRLESVLGRDRVEAFDSREIARKQRPFVIRQETCLRHHIVSY